MPREVAAQVGDDRGDGTARMEAKQIGLTASAALRRASASAKWWTKQSRELSESGGGNGSVTHGSAAARALSKLEDHTVAARLKEGQEMDFRGGIKPAERKGEWAED
uniref:Uncharacterized protein n=1 Tax=Oryza sativa subsp. japonica TaxID=39947 RepID=Q2QUB0_ORYSJ|nr:hypothetical protein LOC_Os12g16870 [Oryza sativa Japonica Group]